MLWIKIGLFLTQIPSQRHSDISKETENTPEVKPGPAQWHLPCGDTQDSDRQICFSLQLYLPRTRNNFCYLSFLCHSLLGCVVGISERRLNESSVCLLWLDQLWLDQLLREPSYAKGPETHSTLSQRWSIPETCSHDSQLLSANSLWGKCQVSVYSPRLLHPATLALFGWTEETTTKVRTKCGQEFVLSPDYEALWRVMWLPWAGLGICL